MKKIMIRLITVLLTITTVLSIPCLADAVQESTAAYPYIEDVELLCDYFNPNSALFRIKAAENAEHCFGRIELWDKTENRIISAFDDTDGSAENSNIDKRGFDCLSFILYSPFRKESDYAVIIPAEAFYEDLCAEYAIPVPTEDVVYSFSGEKLFDGDFKPFFAGSFDDISRFGYYGNPVCEFYGIVYFKKKQRDSFALRVLVSPSWHQNLTFKATCSNGADAELKLNGSTAEIKHYNGSVNLGIYDGETGEHYDDVYIMGTASRSNTPTSFFELLSDTAYKIAEIIILPFYTAGMTLFGTGMGTVVAVSGLSTVIEEIIRGIRSLF